jgi:hypothetical protein
MKNANEIILTSRQRQLAMDAMIQSAINEDMFGPVVDSLTVNGTLAINALRAIEKEMYDALGITYNLVTYNSALGFMAHVAIPQIQRAGDIKEYYTGLATAMLAEVEDEYAQDNFTGSNVEGTNQIFTKSATWITAEGDIQSALQNIIDELNGDPYDNS